MPPAIPKMQLSAQVESTACLEFVLGKFILHGVVKGRGCQRQGHATRHFNPRGREQSGARHLQE